MPDSFPRPLHVFLCYYSGDRPAGRELYQKLNSEGWLDVWLDEENLLPGQDFDLELKKAVEAADVIIVCLSSNSVTKVDYAWEELKFVLDIALRKPDGTIFVIPLRLDNCEPPQRLRGWQYADYFPPSNRDQAYTRLLNTLRTHAYIGLGRGKARTIPDLAKDVHEKSKEDPLLPNLRKFWPDPDVAEVWLDEIRRREATSTKVSESHWASKQVFISYARKDVDFANKLNNDLKGYQLKTWIDQLGIRSGDDWPDRIANAILESQAVLVIISPSAIESKWVARELSFADKHNKLILPLIHRSCTIPHWFDLRFGNTQRADFTKGAYEGNLKDLLESLKELLKK